MGKKHFILIIVLAFCIQSCKKDKDTTFTFENTSSNALFEFSTYHKEEGVKRNVKDHGIIKKNEITEQVSTQNTELYFSFSLDFNGVEYECNDPVVLKSNSQNSIVIDENIIRNGVSNGTTYYILNSTSFELYKCVSFYWTGTTIIDIEEHHTLSQSERTKHIKTSRDEIVMGFTFEPDGEYYFIANPFQLTQDKINRFIVSDNTQVFGGGMKSKNLKSVEFIVTPETKTYKIIDIARR